MDFSSDSSDTIILSPNDANEPSDSEIENILKKYSSTSSSNEFKESTSLQSNISSEFTDIPLNKKIEKNSEENNIRKTTIQMTDYSYAKNKYNFEGNSGDIADSGEFSDEDLVDIPLIKRVKKNFSGNSVKKYTSKSSDWNKSSSEDSSNHPNNNIECVVENKFGNTNISDDSDNILRELYNKYLPSSSKPSSQDTNLVFLSDESYANEPSNDDFPRRLEKFASGVSDELEQKKVDKGNIYEDINSSSEDGSREELCNLSPKAAVKKRKQKELEKKRMERAREKKRKQEEAEEKKAMKNALKAVEQSTRPDECIKHMIVEMAIEISQKDYVEVLKATLKSNGISFKSTSQALPNLVSWCRKVQTLENMFLKNTEVNEKNYLLIMDKSEFLDLVRNNTLTIHIQSISNLLKFKQLTVCVFGVEKAKGDQDLAITEAQMLTKCYFRFAKNSEDLVVLVVEVTKAIAQIPYKLKKEEKYKLQTEYFNDSNKDTVRVDKNGNGLGRLWHQMLTMFPLARLETAEAITAAYPTPVSLFKAYDSCDSKKEELLQNLPIRRALGPCISVRRIGPELSRKCFNFFCSTDNVLI